MIVVEDLSCDHEEADTKLVALAAACSAEPGSTIMVRSPFGDIDILALFIGHDFPDIKVLVDNGTGKTRKILDITSSELSEKEKKALIATHAFSGNDYVSSFFRKGKQAFWKAVLKNGSFVELFSQLGSQQVAGEELLKGLEIFICFLYGFPHIESVNEARGKLFWRKFDKEKKIIELSLMPPCERNLTLHTRRANSLPIYSEMHIS